MKKSNAVGLIFTFISLSTALVSSGMSLSCTSEPSSICTSSFSTSKPTDASGGIFSSSTHSFVPIATSSPLCSSSVTGLLPCDAKTVVMLSRIDIPRDNISVLSLFWTVSALACSPSCICSVSPGVLSAGSASCLSIFFRVLSVFLTRFLLISSGVFMWLPVRSSVLLSCTCWPASAYNTLDAFVSLPCGFRTSAAFFAPSEVCSVDVTFFVLCTAFCASGAFFSLSIALCTAAASFALSAALCTSAAFFASSAALCTSAAFLASSAVLCTAAAFFASSAVLCTAAAFFASTAVLCTAAAFFSLSAVLCTAAAFFAFSAFFASSTVCTSSAPRCADFA